MAESNSYQSPTVISFFSELQQKILIHVGTIKNASYRTLVKEIGRDRITILQSIESLIEYHYVEKRKINPKYQKSRLTFMLTHKGIAAAWLRGFLNTDDIIKNLDRDDNITKYIKIVHYMFNSPEHKQMLESMFEKLEMSYSGYEGEEESDQVSMLIKESFLTGIVELAFGENYDPNRLFSDLNVGWLKWLFSHGDLEQFKKTLVRGRDNITSTIQRFPV
ncbi:MAG: hypothetical protein JO297_04920 [Nitrososphaeraceae archaeon]|nr:hypothetical protein [Nitrososphaeraceae archaeon]